MLTNLFHRLPQFVRYYGVGAVNAGFGYALFSIFVFVGVELYLAQLMAHILGVAFNYVTYSRHVFRSEKSARFRFVISYVINYFIGLGSLLLISQVIANAYIAGFLAIVMTSLINYFMLKYGVFARPESA